MREVSPGRWLAVALPMLSPFDRHPTEFLEPISQRVQPVDEVGRILERRDGEIQRGEAGRRGETLQLLW